MKLVVANGQMPNGNASKADKIIISRDAEVIRFRDARMTDAGDECARRTGPI